MKNKIIVAIFFVFAAVSAFVFGQRSEQVKAAYRIHTCGGNEVDEARLWVFINEWKDAGCNNIYLQYDVATESWGAFGVNGEFSR